MTKRKKILFSVALIMPMLIMFYFMDLFPMMWMLFKDLASQLVLTKEEAVMALKAFGIILVTCMGLAGGIILWDALSKQSKNSN